MWDSYKYSLYSKFREPKLFRYAAEGEWDLIPKRCQNHPHEAAFVHKYAPMDTALNRLLRTQSCETCSDEVKQSIMDMKHAAASALLEAHPGAATTPDSFRRTPLHWACMDVTGNHTENGESIIMTVLERAPSAMHMLDIENRTPLHYLVARSDVIPLQLLAKMVALAPECLAIKDTVAETPIDIIRSRDDEIENYDEVITTLQKLQSMF